MGPSELVKNLLSIKARREAKAERERAEERQAKLDQEALEQRQFENEQAIRDAEMRKEAHEAQMEQFKQASAKAAAEADQHKHALAQEAHEMKLVEEEEKLATKHEELRMKLQEKGLSPQKIKSVLGDSFKIRGEAPVGPIGIPLLTRPQRLQRQAEEARTNPQVMSALLKAGAGAGQPLTDKVKGVGLVEWRGPEQGWVVAVSEGEGGKDLRDLGAKDARELANMRTMAHRARDLGSLVSGAEYNLAKWTPEFAESFISQYVKGEDGNPIKKGFFQRALEVEPQYFLFAAEMLKAMQGSRPSDRDMEWYIENLPKATDTPETKKSKIKDMVNRLANKYNNEVSALKAVRFDMSGFPVMNAEDILRGLEDIDVGGEVPPGFRPKEQ
jgi:hypothetical protein